MEEEIQMAESETSQGQSLSEEDKKTVSIDLSQFTSLERFESTVEKEEPKQRSISEDYLKEVWTNYAEKSASPQLKVMMGEVDLNLEEEEIVIQVPSEMVKVRVQDEGALIEKLRAAVGNHSMKLKFEITKKVVVEETDKLPVTARERLEFMIDKNVFFEEMINKFSLRLED